MPTLMHTQSVGCVTWERRVRNGLTAAPGTRRPDGASNERAGMGGCEVPDCVGVLLQSRARVWLARAVPVSGCSTPVSPSVQRHRFPIGGPWDALSCSAPPAATQQSPCPRRRRARRGGGAMFDYVIVGAG